MKTLKLIFVILLTINLGGAIAAHNNEKVESERTSGGINSEKQIVRFACIGNSITQGSHLDNPSVECYPSQLRGMLSSIYGDTCMVNNYGLSGRNMLKNGPNPIWVEPKFKKALNWAPDICFILLGTNDARPNLWEEYGNEFMADYLDMIDTFKTINPETRFIIGAPTPIWEGHPYGGDTWGKKHNDSIMVNCVIPLINSISETTGAELIDFHTPFKDSVHLFPDHLHPNAEGANYVAKLICERMEQNDMIRAVIKLNSVNK